MLNNCGVDCDELAYHTETPILVSSGIGGPECVHQKHTGIDDPSLNWLKAC